MGRALYMLPASAATNPAQRIQHLRLSGQLGQRRQHRHRLPSRPWLVAEHLTQQGIRIVNTEMTGITHTDRRLLTIESPLASNELGLLTTDALVNAATAE
jgi:hypothetical protein